MSNKKKWLIIVLLMAVIVAGAYLCGELFSVTLGPFATFVILFALYFIGRIWAKPAQKPQEEEEQDNI